MPNALQQGDELHVNKSVIQSSTTGTAAMHHSSGAAGYNDAASTSCSELTSMVMYVL